MEEKIIEAVCGHLVLYDTCSMFYRDHAKKEQVWVKSSGEVELPVSFIDMCCLLLFRNQLCFTMNQTLAPVSTS